MINVTILKLRRIHSAKPKFNVTLLGDSSTGKTQLVSRYVDNKFDTSSQPTIGVDFKYNPTVEGINCTWQIWDTSGQEEVRNIILPDCSAAILCFDLTNKKSFEKIKMWKQQVESKLEKKQDQVAWFLVGTKNDLADRRTVTEEEVQKLVHEIGATYFETSAKTGENVGELFTKVATQCLGLNKNTPDIDHVFDDYNPFIYQPEPHFIGFSQETKSHDNPYFFFSTVFAGAVGGACVGAGVGLIFSGATFGSSAIAGMVIGAFLGAVIAVATYRCVESLENRLTC